MVQSFIGLFPKEAMANQKETLNVILGKQFSMPDMFAFYMKKSLMKRR